MRRRKWLAVIAVILAAVAFIFIRTYDGRPGAIPSAEEAAAAINQYEPEADAEVVLDRIRLDDRQLFVPYVSGRGTHGMGFLKWEKGEWKVTRVDPGGSPELRILDHSNPSERYIVWNINPQEQMEQIRFYLIRERNAGMSSGIYYYTPRVQMEETADLTKRPYGALPFPEDWADILREEKRMNQALPGGVLDQLFSGMPSRHAMLQMGWFPDYAEDAPPPRGYSKSGDEDTEFLWILDEPNLEKPGLTTGED
ncbi:hypothetical protein [Paenibacillus soyae]|uniref:Uncharacterized protein n=1 Tax=Paenibacillus soyae TaxID=2969249 RepID=A0A9X2SAQ7_9BACL|nr:hypothetical protein [Paenibacillus soyae]MCR2806571.1 hypothetical protein [Paenibacillus soyae]